MKIYRINTIHDNDNKTSFKKKNIIKNIINNIKIKENAEKLTKIGFTTVAATLGISSTKNLNNTNKINNIEESNLEMEKFIKLREEFSNDLEKISVNAEKTCWNFYTNSNNENMEKYEQAQNDYSNLFHNEDMYKKFLDIDKTKLEEHEAKQLKNILKEFDEELNTGEELKALRQKENEIAQKFNSYIPKIDGKEVTKTEIGQILQTETNPEIRKKAYDAKVKGGDLIADDMIEFIKQRNEYAKKKGYDNYFEYKLKEDYEVDSEFLNKLIKEVNNNSNEKIKDILSKREKELKDFYKIDKLENYHYGLLLDSNPEKAVNEILKDNDIVSISKKMYTNMGYDIENLEKNGNLTLDLFPRKGKNTHGFCFGVEAGKDSRILANLINNANSLDTINHEMGHCMYDLAISTDLPFLDRSACSPAVTEAIAMMMGDIIKTEDVLGYIVPKDKLDKFKESHKEDEAGFVAKSLLIIDFEREIYANPDQDPAKLWNDLNKKYLGRKTEANNEWATIPHYLSHPAYYQNYFRANLMKAQIYNHLKKELGDITENPKTAEYMNENIFKLGASIEEYDLIKQLTGKDFSAKDFIESLK